MGAFSDTQITCDYELMESEKSRTNKEIVNVEEAQVKVVIFICGASKYAFYGSDIKEILSSFEISWVPCLPEYLPGLINNRGDIESVVEIRHFLGESHNGQSTCLIAMAERGAFHTGIIIDAIEDVVDIPISRIHPPH
jgi:purine-binding chemotaxis protein CheW